MEKVIISEKEENGFRMQWAYELFQTRAPVSERFPTLAKRSGRVVILQEEKYCTATQKKLWKDIVSELLAIGYKYDFLSKILNLKKINEREMHYFLCALIAADLEQDKKYIYARLPDEGYAIDGFFHFRLKALQTKWRKITECIPDDFTPFEAERFLQYLVDGNRGEVYIKTDEVYGGNYRLCKRGMWLKEGEMRGAKTEILLSCAKGVHIIGKPSAELLPFIQKYYGAYAVFNE